MSGPEYQVPASGGTAAVGGREAYFRAAHELLAEQGHEAVTIAAICERIGASKGAFYHHFSDVSGFLVAFIGWWKQGFMKILDGWAAESDPMRRAELMVNTGPEYVTAANSAILGWSLTEPPVAAAVQDLDERLTALRVATFVEVIGDPELGPLLQSLGQCIQLGATLRIEPFDFTHLFEVTAEFARRIIGSRVEVADAHGTPRFTFLDDPGSAHRAGAVQTPPPLHGLTWAAPEPSTYGAATEGGEEGRVAWFVAARELLAEGGAERITVESLCRRVRLSRGSFQHHFANMPGFVEALAEHWALRHERRLAAIRADAGPMEGLTRLHQELLRAPDPAEVAFRAWARTDPVIAATMIRIDRARQDQLQVAISGATGDPAAAVLAELMLDLDIGLHQPATEMDPDLAARIVQLWADQVLHLGARIELDGTEPRVVLHGSRTAEGIADSARRS